MPAPHLAGPLVVAGHGSMVLRALTAADWRLEQQLSTDPDVVRWTTIPAALTEEQARARVQRRRDAVARGDIGYWVVEHDQVAVGTIGAAWSTDTVEISYALVAAARGRGLVATALAALVAALEASAATLTLATFPDNFASQRTASRAGFIVSGSESRKIKGCDQELLTWTRPTRAPG